MTPAFVYRASTVDGAEVAGDIRADDRGDALAKLLERGVRPTSIRQAPWRVGYAARGDLAIVMRSLAELVSMGVPLDRALGATESVVDGPLERGVAEARTFVREGHGLAESLERSNAGFPRVTIGLLRAAEGAGTLEEGLRSAALQLEQEADLRSRLVHAMAYPLLLLIAGLASLALMLTVVIPRFGALLSELGQSLPPMTRALLFLSDLVADHATLLLGLSACAALTAFGALRTSVGRLRWHRALLAMPYIGGIRFSLATARVARTIGGMMSSGMPILEAMDAAREAVGDSEIAARVVQARNDIVRGASITSAFRDATVLTPRALQLFAIGDESGLLGTMALRAGDLAASEADRRLRTAVTLIEPAMVVSFGGAIAFVAAALLQAIYALRPAGS